MNAQDTQYRQKTARAAINEATRGHSNVLTPYAVRFGLIAPDLAYEISQGEGIERETLLVGVTFARRIDGKWKPEYDLSTSFVSSRTADRLDIAQTDASAFCEALDYLVTLP